MIGKPTVTVKPSRSDEICDSDHQLKISESVRSHFNSILPKRPLKPNRSDPDHVSPESHSDEPVSTIPELIKFHSLSSQSQGLVIDANPTIEHEFVETEYYNQLLCIDKQHHTTGNGFIKVDRDDDLYDIGVKIGSESGDRYRDGVSRSNPATNDWIPSCGDYYHQGEFMSLKPNRSENW